jgi:hypothetical protein
VRETRAIHRTATEDVYKARMEAVLGRPIEAHMSSIHVDPDVAVDICRRTGESRRTEFALLVA